MKLKLPELSKRNVYFAGLIILFAVCVSIVVYQTSCKSDALQEAIQTNQSGAQTAVNEAANASNSAVNSEVERRVEDGTREKVIRPKLEISRRKSAESAQQLKRAKQKLNEIEKNLHNINASRAANCTELARLFPDEQFEYCRQR